MSDVNVKIKDLATELGVVTKEIYRAARDIDSEHKSTVTVPEAMVSKLKAHFQGQAAQAKERRQLETGVIVRRRRPTADVPQPVSDDTGTSAAAPESGANLDSVATQKPEVAAQQASEVVTSAKATLVPSAPPLASDSVALGVDAPASTPLVADPDAKPEALSGAPQAKAKKAPKPRPEPVAAKIISMPKKEPVEPIQEPAPSAVVAVATEAVAANVVDAESNQDKASRRQPAASARPEGSSAPSLLPPVQDRGSEFADQDGSTPPLSYTPATTTQVRVILRPDPAAKPAQAPRSDARPGARDGRPDTRPNDGRPRPASFGGPGGAPRPAGPGGPGGAPRPAGPGGPGGPGGAPRPPGAYGAQAPGGFPPAGGAPFGDGQSKKKRNKNQNRRTDVFTQDAGAVSRRRVDSDDDMPRSRGRRRSKRQALPQPATQPIKAIKRKIRIEEAIRLADLAHQMGIKANEIIKVLFNLGIMATINMSLDLDTAGIVATEFGYEVEKAGFFEADHLAETVMDAPENLRLRPPVVTIMGHVDHGKTSLLDAIRKTHVTDGEAGGITQHIGAYHVATKRGDIVFLDTPGHEAFTAMRARGAQITDLVVLVVAADDGVMEQTREAANHAKAAGVPILVAVNKMDKEGADPERVLRELSELGLVPEDWGGETVVAKLSAKTRDGLDDFLEVLALQADILELRANPDKPARGHIVEAKLDKGRGPVATVLIQEGTLRQGDSFVCGAFSGRVRAMFNDQGRKVKEAGPSMPVEVQGFAGVPDAGEAFVALVDEKMARRIADGRAIKLRERELSNEARITLETFLASSPDTKEAQVLNLVVKSDVQGSLEAIVDALAKLSTDQVRINVVHGGVGAITESDILLASASDAIIIGFNVRPTTKVKDVADHENVDIRFYSIIYKLVDEIKSAMEGLLAPIIRENVLGQAEVREVFSVPKLGAVAGSHITDGKLVRNAGVRILRDGVVVHTGKIISLRRFKDDVREVQKGYECGVGLENYNDIKVGDVFEAFETIEEAATL